jgi:Metallo-beta-lactamase superfamily
MAQRPNAAQQWPVRRPAKRQVLKIRYCRVGSPSSHQPRRDMMAPHRRDLEIDELQRSPADPGIPSTNTGPSSRNWPLPDSLLRQIDLVVCTHLHVDHMGWNTRLVDGDWIPTFPHARYLFGAADIDSFAQSHDSLHAPAFADSVRDDCRRSAVDVVEAATTRPRPSALPAAYQRQPQGWNQGP